MKTIRWLGLVVLAALPLLFGASQTASAVRGPSTVSVDDEWVGLPEGEEVYFPGDSDPHYIGVDPDLVAAPKVRVLINFKGWPGSAEHRLVRHLGGQVRYSYRLIPAMAADLPEPAIEALRRHPLVASVTPDHVVHALEDNLGWGADRIDAERVWGGAEDAVDVASDGNGGAGVRVAILDTGLDADHPDLAANIDAGSSRNFVRKCLRSLFMWCREWEPEPDPDAWDDDNGHGSHVGGVVAAADNGLGYLGVAPEATLIGVKVLDASGMGYLSDIIAGIEWAVNQGAQVINMSLGCTACDDPNLRAAVDAVWAAGLVVVAAAGNEGSGADTVLYPARYDSVIAVAATDQNDNRASFSSTGPAVELAAPGVDVYSATAGGGYEMKSATSMASPHVAGTAALVWACGIDGVAGDGRTNVDVRLRLQETADYLGNPDWFGYGLVDADEAALPSCEPWLERTPTPTSEAPGSPTASPTPGTITPTPAPPVDTDGDGCADIQEEGPFAAEGGQRDPLNPWDFYDVPTPAIEIVGDGAAKDRAITASDLAGVLYYSGTVENGSPNTRGVDYDDDKNSNGIPDGREYDRTATSDPTKPWRAGPPDGGIAGADLGALLASSGADCRFLLP